MNLVEFRIAFASRAAKIENMAVFVTVNTAKIGFARFYPGNVPHYSKLTPDLQRSKVKMKNFDQIGGLKIVQILI